MQGGDLFLARKRRHVKCRLAGFRLSRVSEV